MERIGWIDFLRGISMILILVFHTEVYYKEYDITPYYIYTSNAIILFYFISGYLFFSKKEFNFTKKIKSIIRSLLIPYFIFTSLIALPKVLIRNETFNWQETILNILSGRASWFIAALIIAEILFSILLKVSQGKHKYLLTIAILFLIIYYFIPFNHYNLWQWQDAMLAYIFIYAGYSYHRYDLYFNSLNKPLYSFILILILILIKVYEYYIDLPMRNIAIECAPLFVTDSFVWLVLIVSLIYVMPRCRLIEWTGQHCIIYYFISGGCPLVVSLIMRRFDLPYENHIWRYILALFFVYVLSTTLSWILIKVPFIIKKNE